MGRGYHPAPASGECQKVRPRLSSLSPRRSASRPPPEAPCPHPQDGASHDARRDSVCITIRCAGVQRAALKPRPIHDNPIHHPAAANARPRSTINSAGPAAPRGRSAPWPALQLLIGVLSRWFSSQWQWLIFDSVSYSLIFAPFAPSPPATKGSGDAGWRSDYPVSLRRLLN